MKLVTGLPPIKNKNLDISVDSEPQTEEKVPLIQSSGSSPIQNPQNLISSYFRNSQSEFPSTPLRLNRNNSLQKSMTGKKVEKLLHRASKVINRYQSIDLSK